MVELVLFDKAVQLVNDPKYRKQKLGIGSKSGDKDKEGVKANAEGAEGSSNDDNVFQEGIISSRRLTGKKGDAKDDAKDDEEEKGKGAKNEFTTNANGAGPGPGGVLTNIKSMVANVVLHKGKDSGGNGDVGAFNDASEVFSPVSEEQIDEDGHANANARDSDANKGKGKAEYGVEKGNESLNEENQIGDTNDHPIYKNEPEEEEDSGKDSGKDPENSKIHELNFKNIEKVLDKQHNNENPEGDENGKAKILNLDLQNYDLDQDINSDDSILDKIKDEDINIDHFGPDHDVSGKVSGGEMDKMGKEFEELNIKQKNIELNNNSKKNGENTGNNKELQKIKNKKKQLKIMKLLGVVRHFHLHHKQIEKQEEEDDSSRDGGVNYASVHPSAADYEKSSYLHRNGFPGEPTAEPTGEPAGDSPGETSLDQTKNTAKDESKQKDNDEAKQLGQKNEEIRHDTAAFADGSAGDPSGGDVGQAGHDEHAGDREDKEDKEDKRPHSDSSAGDATADATAGDSKDATPLADHPSESHQSESHPSESHVVVGKGKEIPMDYGELDGQNSQRGQHGQSAEVGTGDSSANTPDYSPGHGQNDGKNDDPKNVVSGDALKGDQQAEAWGDADNDDSPVQIAGSAVGRVRDKLKSLV